ncbi:MAG: SDR family NAD(P)-dependent oxidoreductase [Gammaproteobacteria bacterium]|nr:SDR family NAD(P)-dependent oxidoreductase [Gammaproteobacteria bacterium]
MSTFIDLSDKVAIITGGAQGIGLAIARRMLQSQAKVVLWDSNLEKLKHAEDILQKDFDKQKIFLQEVELTQEEQIQQAQAELLKKWSVVHILVNNAGITGGNAPTWELESAVWRQVIEVNLIAPFLVCKQWVPHFRSHQYGRIVNIASVAGKEGNPNASHYSASKAGLIALTKSLGKELAQSGILVNAITPAAAHTAIFDQMTKQHIDYMLSKIPMGRFVEIEEIAAMATWLASNECTFSTGAVFDITGGRASY